MENKDKMSVIVQLESSPSVVGSLTITCGQYYLFMYSKETLQMT